MDIIGVGTSYDIKKKLGRLQRSISMRRRRMECGVMKCDALDRTGEAALYNITTNGRSTMH